MDAFQAKMNRARMTDQIKQDKLRTSRSTTSRRQSTTTILSHEEKNLSIQGQKLVPLTSSSSSNQPDIILSPSEKQRRGSSLLEQHEKGRYIILKFISIFAGAHWGV